MTRRGWAGKSGAANKPTRPFPKPGNGSSDSGEARQRCWTNARFFGPGAGRTLLAEHPTGPRVIHWNRLILATGARELFLPFPGWTLPGNFGPGGLQSLAKHGWPVAGKRIVLAGSGPLLLAVGGGLRAMGASIVSINEQAPLSRLISFGAALLGCPEKLAQAARLKWTLLGTPFRCGVWPVAAEGAEQMRAVVLTDGRRQWREECDLLACGFRTGAEPRIALGPGLSIGQ